MTHDELLAKMKELSRTFAYEPNLNFESALRAVVELHKPEWVLPKIVLGDSKPKPITICSFCSDEPYRTLYPCQTIQAIEKELA